MRAARMPTRKPTLSVLVIAVSKAGMASTRLNTSSVRPLSPTTLSTMRMASGYRMNSVRNATSTAIVVTMMGSAMSFLRSSRTLWFFAIAPLLESSANGASLTASRVDGETHPPGADAIRDDAVWELGATRSGSGWRHRCWRPRWRARS